MCHHHHPAGDWKPVSHIGLHHHDIFVCVMNCFILVHHSSDLSSFLYFFQIHSSLLFFSRRSAIVLMQEIRPALLKLVNGAVRGPLFKRVHHGRTVCEDWLSTKRISKQNRFWRDNQMPFGIKLSTRRRVSDGWRTTLFIVHSVADDADGAARIKWTAAAASLMFFWRSVFNGFFRFVRERFRVPDRWAVWGLSQGDHDKSWSETFQSY